MQLFGAKRIWFWRTQSFLCRFAYPINKYQEVIATLQEWMWHVHPMICLSIILYTCTCTGLSWSPLFSHLLYYIQALFCTEYSIHTPVYICRFTLLLLFKRFFFFKKKAPSPSIRSIFEHKNVGKFLGWEFSCCSYHQKKQNNCITKHFWKLETQYFIQLFFVYQGTYIGCILVYFVPGDIVLTAW